MRKSSTLRSEFLDHDEETPTIHEKVASTTDD